MATTRKTVKIETPIDERETFVSLQKAFADSESSVEEKLKTLYELQKVDNEIEKILQLRGELPAEVSDLEQTISTMNAKIEKFKDLIAATETGINDSKAEIEGIVAEMDKYNKQLENISNSREFDSIQKEVENLELCRQIGEKKIGESKIKIEEYKASIDELLERIAVREADLKAKREELESIATETAVEEEALNAKRAALTEKIDARTISAYERIRNSVHNRLAVVSVYNGNSCGGCFNTITPQRLVDIASGKKLVICEHCGRIIVNEE